MIGEGFFIDWTRMNLALRILEQYKSNSQIARIVTEEWVCENMYCPHCGGRLVPYPPNTKSKDVFCANCGEDFQIKSSKGKLGNRVLGAEYNTTRRNLEAGENPSFILLQYSVQAWSVVNVQIIPRAFITLSCVIPRKKLSPDARRAGWQGCNYDLTLVPASARIQIVANGIVQHKEIILGQWKATLPILKLKPSSRRWTNDVLRIVESLPVDFDLTQVYRFVPKLTESYPDNHHIEDKIRQQLQILRDMGKLRFLSKGKYQRII